jgi:hypothetical protein
MYSLAHGSGYYHLCEHILPAKRNTKTVKRGTVRTPRRFASRQMAQTLIPRPPSIGTYNIRHNVRVRFITNATVLANITFQNLLDTILISTSATAGFDLFEFVKIRRIEMWALGTIGSSDALSLQYGGGTTGVVGDNRIHVSNSMGIEPAYINAKPSPKALVSNYQMSTTAVAFTLEAPAGCVVDVELSFINSYGSAVAAQNALVAAAVGTVYLRGLDGLAAATTKFTPAFAEFI